jgi:ABC-type oligopeptide transport system substrate-binding subunit
MNRKILHLAVALLAIAALLGAGCARQPSAKKSSNIIKHSFKKYGKKYPNTVYGRNPVKEVEVTGQQEIHKGLVAVESFVTLSDGDVQRVHATLERGPLGWKFTSWENETRQ